MRLSQPTLKKKYDVIIVGAGIGGLVCGAYLAKAGMKVLVVEKHDKVGGYCTSFKRRGYLFDAAVHSLRGLKEANQLGIVLRDLNINKKKSFKRIDPSDVIIYRNKRVCVYNDINNTIDSFINVFPQQRREIRRFFDFMVKSDFVKLYQLTSQKNFFELLAEYFSDNDLMSCFNILLGNLGIDCRRISALSSMVFLHELFTDGGYYPVNGIQAFPDILANKIKNYGGELLLQSEVAKICLKGRSVSGIMLTDGLTVSSRNVVSNVDATYTYNTLIGSPKLSLGFKDKMASLELSPSACIVYLGLHESFEIKEKCGTLWYFPLLKSTGCYRECFVGKYSLFGTYSIIGLSAGVVTKNKPAISITNVFPWSARKTLEKNKGAYADVMVNRCKELLGFDENSICVEESATPYTLYRYTYNNNGALYGWASTPMQIRKNIMPQISAEIENLYLCGHWASRGWGQGGISMVANSGRTTAELILKRKTHV